ncbi:MAG: PfkB family carbohydrate kinase, partial [bacterium]|nr:PfkB family carbohydrate kinase [bacterium]
KYAAWLKKNKVDISGVKAVKDELTAGAYIMTDQADNQITAFYPGSLTPLTPLCNGGENTIAIIAPDTVARMREYAKIFKQKRIPYIFDPGQQITALSAKDLVYFINGAKVLIGNDYEIQLILNKIKIKLGALEKLMEILIITKGAKGSEIYNQGKKIIIPPARAKNLSDPTGAGDAYRAGFIKGLALSWSLEKCGRLAGVVAVYTVEKYGTQTHRFSWQELGKRYRENYKESL